MRRWIEGAALLGALLAVTALSGCSTRRTVLMQFRDAGTKAPLAGARVECREERLFVPWHGERSGTCDGAGIVRFRISEAWNEYAVTVRPTGTEPAWCIITSDWPSDGASYSHTSSLQRWFVPMLRFFGFVMVPATMANSGSPALEAASGPALYAVATMIKAALPIGLPPTTRIDEATWFKIFDQRDWRRRPVEMRLQVVPREPTPPGSVPA